MVLQTLLTRLRLEKWLLPHHMGFASCHKPLIDHLEFKPGVYEFAIYKGNDTRYKMYVG